MRSLLSLYNAEWFRMPLEKLSPMLKQLMGGLFSILNRPDQKDSEYVMRGMNIELNSFAEEMTCVSNLMQPFVG